MRDHSFTPTIGTSRGDWLPKKSAAITRKLAGLVNRDGPSSSRHPEECDIGMGWTAHFCDALPTGARRKTSIAPSTACRAPAASSRRRLEFPGGLRLWLNEHPTEEWRIRAGAEEITLPPAGWAAITHCVGTRPGGELLSYSARCGAGKVDHLRSREYTYLGGRGQLFPAPEAASRGALAISPLSRHRLQVIHIAGEDAFTIRRPSGVRGPLTRIRAYDVEGKPLSPPRTRDAGGETQIEPVAGAVRYDLEFSG